MTIDPNANWTRFWFVPNQKDLKYQLKVGHEQTLLDGVVKNATFEAGPNDVNVSIELQNGDCEAQLKSTTMWRNRPVGP